MRAKTTAQTKKPPPAPPTTCCFAAATCPLDVAGSRSPGRGRHSRPSARPQHVHKRLVLEPSVAPVCNCSELLRLLQTTINEPPPPPPPPHRDVFDTSGFSVKKSPRSDSLFALRSTASYDDAIVIDSDDSEEEKEDPNAESHPAEPVLPTVFEIPQSPQNDSFPAFCDDSESPGKPLDLLPEPEPVDISIKVCLPLPRKLLPAERPSPVQIRQKSVGKKRRRFEPSWYPKKRKKATGRTKVPASVQKSSEAAVPAASCAGDEVAEIGAGVGVDSDIPCETGRRQPTDNVEDERRTNSVEADGATARFVDDQRPLRNIFESVAVTFERGQRSSRISETVEPDRSSSSSSPRLTIDESVDDFDVLRSEEERLHDEMADDVEPATEVLAANEFGVLRQESQQATSLEDVEPEALAASSNQLPDQFVDVVPPLETGASATTLSEEDDGISQLLAAAEVTNSSSADNEECGTSEMTLGGIEASLSDERHSFTNASTDDTEIYAVENHRCSPVAVDVDDRPSTSSTNDAEVSLPEQTEVCRTVSDEPDASVAHVDEETLPSSLCSRVPLASQKRSKRISARRGPVAAKKNARKIKKYALNWWIFVQRRATSWTSKRFRKFARARKRYRALNARRQPQTKENTEVASVANGCSADVVSDEKSLLSVEEDLLVQTYAETDLPLTSVEHVIALAAESVPARQRTPSPGVAAPVAAEVDEACCSSSLADDRRESFQVVTGQPSGGSPAHTDDGDEVAGFSAAAAAASNESVASPSGAADWNKPGSSGNHDPLAYSESRLRNRLRGTHLLRQVPDVTDSGLLAITLVVQVEQ